MSPITAGDDKVGTGASQPTLGSLVEVAGVLPGAGMLGVSSQQLHSALSSEHGTCAPKAAIKNSPTSNRENIITLPN